MITTSGYASSRQVRRCSTHIHVADRDGFDYHLCAGVLDRQEVKGRPGTGHCLFLVSLLEFGFSSQFVVALRARTRVVVFRE